MGTLVNYLVKGSYNVRTGILIGVIIYLLLFSVLLVIPGRRKVTLRNLPELLLICCCTSILSITGAFSLNFATFQFGFANVGLIPFLGGSVVPMVLNFLLFVPLGFLLLLVFQKLNWKKALLIGCGFSAFIELLQLFGGRYAELEDIVLNSAGTLAGFLFLDCLKTCKKKSILSLLLLLAVIGLLFGVLSLVYAPTEEPANSLESIGDNIAQCRFLHDGKTIDSSMADYEFQVLKNTLSNGGGHLFEIESVDPTDVPPPESYCIEMKLKEPQTITISNDGRLVIESVDNLLFDATENVLYWGCDGYGYAVSYARFDESLKPHEAEILAGYEQLCQMITERFAYSPTEQ